MLVAWRRIWALIIKEFLVIVRDPRSRMMLVGPPVLQLIIFAYAATLEVRNVPLLIFNEDRGRHAQELVFRVSGSKTFSRIEFVGHHREFARRLDEQEALAAIHFPQDFSRGLESGRGAVLRMIYDGRRSNAAQITNSYLTQIVNQYNRELTGRAPADGPRAEVVARHWFNENLDYTWFTIPSLVAVLTVVITLSQASMSVAREKELGTFDQLLVSPLKPVEILIGKTVPAMVIGVLEALFIFVMGWQFFGVPFRGSFLLLLSSIAVFAFSIVGFGLFISSLAKTQQQAILGAFVFMVPAISLSGFAAPVENMPLWLQNAVWLNPMRHALILFKGLFLKAMPPAEVALHAWPLALIGVVTLGLAGWMFARKLE